MTSEPPSSDPPVFDGPDRWRWYLLVLEALAWSAAASLAVRLVPFRILAAQWGPVRGAGGTTPGPGDSSAAGLPPAAALRRIGRAVERAAQRLPWPVVCLPQAMAAKGMLASRGISSRLHLGAAPGGAAGGLTAHAWLTCGDATVVGGEARQGFTELARFG